MKHFFRLLTIVIIIVLTANNNTTAQVYKTGIGLRLGGSNGLTIKHFMTGSNAIEGIFSIHYSGFEIVGLYEIHNELKIPDANIKDLSWYYGGGAHVGANATHTRAGIDAVIGVEYPFKEVPLTLGFDIKPYLDILNNTGRFFDTAFSVRYYFK